MDKAKIEAMEKKAEESAQWLAAARDTVANDKGKSQNPDEELDAEVFQEYIQLHSEEKDYEYLVRGAKLNCRCGSHIRMLNLPLCHGVYIGENPMVHEYDCVQGTNGEGNISWFGICTAERSHELPGDNVCYQLTPDNNVNGLEGETEPGKKCHPCIVGVWQDVCDRTKIVDYWEGDVEGEEELCSLTTGSFLVCNYGGIIEPVTSGQEYVMSEKDLGLDENGKSKDGNIDNEKEWEEIKRRREDENAECGEADCSLAHERYDDGDNADHGNIHGTNYFTVVFQYEDGRIIDEQKVKKGESAKAPTELETREGYVFTGWDKEASCISEDMVITAIYEKDWISKIDEIDTVSDFEEERVYTVKYVGKVLLCEGYSVNFVCGVLGNILAEGAKAGYFESSNYKNHPEKKKEYLKHMENHHNYRPDDPEKVNAESISGTHVYDLKAGTSIFSKQLKWDSANNMFLCDDCGDFENHKFGFGICQWTDPGHNPKNFPKPVQEKDLGRLPKLIKKYLDEFGENAKPSRDECLRLETEYLLEEFCYEEYASIAGIHKEDCTLEKATEDILSIFEHPSDWKNKKVERLKNAQAVLDAFKGVGYSE